MGSGPAELPRRQRHARARSACRRRDKVMNDFNRRSIESGSGSGSGAIWFVAGALVGAAAALIFAPATGADARAFLGKRGRELADDVAARGKDLWNEHG